MAVRGRAPGTNRLASLLLYTWIAVACVGACSASPAGNRRSGPDEWRSGSSGEIMVEPLDGGAEHAPATTAPAEESADAAPPPEARAPGWYCVEIRMSWEKLSYRSACSKTRASCELTRDKAFFNKIETSECIHVPAAYCYHIENRVEQYHGLVCADTEEQCLADRERSSYTNDPATTTYTDCRLTE